LFPKRRAIPVAQWSPCIADRADTCDGAPQMTSSPASGSVFPVGTNTVTWTRGQLWKFQLLHLHGAVIPYACSWCRTRTTRVPVRCASHSRQHDAPDDNTIIFSLTGAGPSTSIYCAAPADHQRLTIDG